MCIKGGELYLHDFVEKKLKECLKKMKSSKPANLYEILIAEFEKPLISLVLEETKGNQSQAAELLGINRNTLRKKIIDLGIKVPKGKEIPEQVAG